MARADGHGAAQVGPWCRVRMAMEPRKWGLGGRVRTAMESRADGYGVAAHGYGAACANPWSRARRSVESLHTAMESLRTAMEWHWMAVGAWGSGRA